ncbi:helix-turn-helix transcriptional regulator [Sphingomonas morindae]|uniref:PAS domain S-box protein n=1 Tax=Sphingomonas morindae TaxID=1541170 RepID=A0ABY4X6R6_9SPHN|nr:PAS domain S-box protein [Sphingomonas morindae]USI72579.1 PAS domain S-box protein [Sphingomonas morindae]
MADAPDRLSMASSLRTLRETVDLRHLRQIIGGLDEGVILIDPDESLLWANAAALRMHGVDRLEALGGDVRGYRARFNLRYRNNHPLGADAYPIERVVAGDHFSDVVVEVARADDPAEQWVHQVRSLALNDGDDEPPACLALIIQDVTARFEAEERFEQSFHANPAPALICRLGDLRFVKVNQGFLEMTGFERDAILGRSVYEVDVLRAAEKRSLATERLAEGRTIPQMEAELALPGGDTKLVIVAGQPIELDDQPCMLFTFADLEPRRKAETALRASEERFTRTFQMAPVAMAIGTRDGHLLCEVNASFVALTGFAPREIIGRSLLDAHLWADDSTGRAIDIALAQGALRGHEARIRTREGGHIDCLVSTEAFPIGEAACLLWAFQDITQRKATEMELVGAIEAVMKDTSWFSRSVMDKLARLRAPRPEAAGPSLNDLTPREREVLGLICRGLDDKSIARALRLSTNTVRNHVARIYGKIGVNRRTAAAVWARARGFGEEQPAPGRPHEASA